MILILTVDNPDENLNGLFVIKLYYSNKFVFIKN